MNRLARTVVLAVLISLLIQPFASAEESVSKFVSGLKARGYFDTAGEYLDAIEQRPDIAPEIRALVPYERAMVLVAASRTIRDTVVRTEQLNLAEIQLNDFIAKNPQHPRVAQASTELGTIQLDRGRVLIWDLRSPANADKKPELQTQAREIIGKARATFQKAHDEYKVEFDKFKVFIKADEKELLAARKSAEIAYMQSQLYLAQARYEEGQTYDEGAKERIEILMDAAKQFEEIHVKYRSIVAGLFARLWQGKCFEEQGEIGRAVGIYNELLDHGGPDASPTLQRLQDRVLRFRLICLNHEKRKDYQLVVMQAEAWLKRWRAKKSTPTGLGVQWELARAYEALGMQADLEPGKSAAFLNSALTIGTDLAKFDGEFADLSNAMVQRLNLKLKGTDVEPEDFMSAFMMSRNMVKQISDLKEKVALAPNPDEQKVASEVFTKHLEKLNRFLSMGPYLKMDDSSEPPLDKINQMKYWKAFLYFHGDRFYESGIASFDVARRFKQTDPQSALEAAHLAVVSGHKAFNRVPDGKNQDPEMEMIRKACDLLVANWPASTQANDARMLLGNVFQNRKDHAEAARWYLEVPPSAEQYPTAQLYAGGELYLAYQDGDSLPRTAPNRPSNTQLKEWLSLSEEHLDIGIPAFEKKLPASQQSEDLTFGKVFRALIHNRKAEHQQVLDLLFEGKHAVEFTIGVPEGEGRPATGAKSAGFAADSYELALHAFVGTQKIDEALDVMQRLDGLGAGTNPELYVNLGRQMEKQLDKLKAEGKQDEVTALSDSLQKFLDSIAERSEGLSFHSFLWLGQTYANIGKRLEKGTQKREEFLEYASDKYGKILAKVASDPTFAKPNQATIVRLKQAEILSLKDDFEQAMTRIEEVLTERPSDLTAHVEACKVLQAWGESDPSANGERFLQALTGKYSEKIWGWAPLSRKLHDKVAAMVSDKARGKIPDTPEITASIADFEEKELAARLGASECRLAYANSLSDNGKKNKQLRSAQTELELFAFASPNLEDEWRVKFSSLYDKVQRARNVQPQPLKWPEPDKANAADAEVVAENKTGDQVASKSVAKTGEAESTDEGGSSMLFIILGTVMAGGAAVGAYFLMGKPQKRTKVSYADSAPTLPATDGLARKAVRKKKAARPVAGASAGKSTAKPVPAQRGDANPKVATASPPEGTKKKVVKKKVVKRVVKKRPPTA